MGLRGPHAPSRKPFVEKTERPITPEALTIYRKMRRHERENGGPGGDEWWAMNAELARCFYPLCEGMVVYEDPAWENPRAFQTDIDMFHRLERAARKKPKRGYQYKWER